MSLEDKQEEFERTLYDLDNEGEGYFFTGYTSADSMPDEKSEDLFQKTVDAINAFRKYIEENSEER